VALQNIDCSKGSKNLLSACIRKNPGTAGAMAFGASTLGVQYFAWYPDARMSGMAHALTVTVALCHAIVGALTAPRLLDCTRTSTASRAALIGAETSFLALGLFAFVFTVYLVVRDVHLVGVLSYVIFLLLTALFAYLADGWMLLLVSTGIGWALYRIAYRSGTTRSHVS
jgi:hypothetical protein